jgi:hypothetical protein
MKKSIGAAVLAASTLSGCAGVTMTAGGWQRTLPNGQVCAYNAAGGSSCTEATQLDRPVDVAAAAPSTDVVGVDHVCGVESSGIVIDDRTGYPALYFCSTRDAAMALSLPISQDAGLLRVAVGPFQQRAAAQAAKAKADAFDAKAPAREAAAAKQAAAQKAAAVKVSNARAEKLQRMQELAEASGGRPFAYADNGSVLMLLTNGPCAVAGHGRLAVAINEQFGVRTLLCWSRGAGKVNLSALTIDESDHWGLDQRPNGWPEDWFAKGDPRPQMPARAFW